MYERMSWGEELLMKDRAKERRQKNFAHGAVRNALKYGRIKKEPCKCGSMQVEAHHFDYDRPLDVVWVCRKHHGELDQVKRELDSFEQLSPTLSTIEA